MRRPGIKKLIELIKNPDATDKKVLEVLKLYLADRIDSEGNVIPPTTGYFKTLTRIRTLMQRLRPKVMEMLRRDFLEAHGPCCHPREQ